MQYGFRDITDVTLIDLFTGEQVLYMDYLQTNSQSFGQEVTYTKGGRGAAKRVSFKSNNSMAMELTTGILTPELLSIMFGTNVTTGVQSVQVTELITATSNTFNLSATPSATPTAANFKISYTADGTTPTTPLTLSATPATPGATEFGVSGAKVTVNSSTYATGGKFIVTYYKNTSVKNKRVKMQSDKFTKAYKVIGYTLWKDAEDELLYPCRVTIPKLSFSIDGTTLNSVMDGDPVAITMKGEALLEPGSTDLIYYDIDEGATGI